MRLRDVRFLAVLREGTPPHWSHRSYLVAVLREGTPPHWSHRSYLADDGKTWTPYEQVNFKGQCPCLVQLRSGAVLCVYRDLEPGRPGMSVSEDGGATWHWVGQIYSGANGTATALGGPDILGRERDGDCEIRGVWLSDDS